MGESQGDHKGRVLQEEAEEWPEVQRGSRLGELAPHRPPPSTSCPRARNKNLFSKHRLPERVQEFMFSYHAHDKVMVYIAM